MTVLKDVRKLVSATVKSTISILKSESVDTNTTYNNGKIDVPTIGVAITAITKENIDEAIFDSGYYDKADFRFPDEKHN